MKTMEKFNKKYKMIMESFKSSKLNRKKSLIKQSQEDDNANTQIKKYFNTNWFKDDQDVKDFIKKNKEFVMQFYPLWFKNTVNAALRGDTHKLNLWGIQPDSFKSGDLTVGQLFSLGLDARNGVYWDPTQLNNVVSEKLDNADGVTAKFKEIVESFKNDDREKADSLINEICDSLKVVKIIPDNLLN